jgi:hypothetical protein
MKLCLAGGAAAAAVAAAVLVAAGTAPARGADTEVVVVEVGDSGGADS